MTAPTYRIERKYQNEKHLPEIVARGLSLEEAKEHCKDPDTSSRTCTSEEGLERTREKGAWFDTYYEE